MVCTAPHKTQGGTCSYDNRLGLFSRAMCYNIIDGRSHKPCGHFVALATRRKDCMRADCLFSRQHVHSRGGQCRSPSCIRLMTPPAFNPIRESPSQCPQCSMVSRGVLL